MLEFNGKLIKFTATKPGTKLTINYGTNPVMGTTTMEVPLGTSVRDILKLAMGLADSVGLVENIIDDVFNFVDYMGIEEPAI